jgi:antitoxin component YwqK of YwqJK toxin-antitoxin module
MKFAILLLGLLGSAWWALGGHMRELRAWEREGVRASYYADGRPESQSSYRDGLRQGMAVEWYPNGAEAARGSYDHGERTGAWTFWRADGSLDRERSGLYAAGQRVGPAQDNADS